MADRSRIARLARPDRGGRPSVGRRVGAILACLCLGALPLRAQDEVPRVEDENIPVNYVYATQFGFGGYEVGGLRVNVYSLPLGVTFDDVVGTWDLDLDFKVTYGRFRFRETAMVGGRTVTVRSDTHTIGGEPELQLDIPIPGVPGLQLSPLGAFGFGTTFSSDRSVEEDGVRRGVSSEENAFYTYQIGLSALYQRPWRDFLFSFGSAFIYAGNASFSDDEDAVVEGYGTYRTGAEVRHPLGFRIGDFVPDVGAYFVYHLFTPDLEFARIGGTALEIDQIFEVGGTFGASEVSRVGWLPGFLNRALNDFSIGIGYQSGDGLDGFRLTFGYPF